MKIDKMQSEDVSTISELENICFSDAWSENTLAESLENDRYVFFVAKDQKKTVGYAGIVLSDDVADVTRIAVFPEFRKKGVGKTLFLALLDECKENGITTIFLEVRADNIPAICLYEKLGGERFGVRKNYYGSGIDALLYRFTKGEKPLGI